VFIPIAALLSNIEFLLLSIGQDPGASHQAGLYAWSYLPALYLMGIFDCERRFLNALGKSNAAMIGQAIGSIVHPIWCYVFVIKMEYGVTGAGLASTISNLIICIVIISYS